MSLIQETKVIPCSISDHDLVIAVLNLKKRRPKPVYISVRSFKNYNKEAFLDDISKVPWLVVDCFDDVDDKLNIFNLLFNQVLDHHAPIKLVKLRSRPNPFVTENIRELMKTRDHWRKLARATNDSAAWSGYKNFKREIKRELRVAQKVFVENQIKENPQNTRNIWKTIRSCIPKKSSDFRTYSEKDKVIANDFNAFFTSVGPEVVNKINILSSECNYTRSHTSFVPRCYPYALKLKRWLIHCQ